MKKKTALHLITGLGIGGAETMLLRMLPYLQKDFNNVVCCIKGHGEIGKEIEKLGIEIIYLEFKGITDLNIISRFKKVIKENQPDLLITYLIHADLFGRFFGRLFGVKKIICSIRSKLMRPKYFPLLILNGITSCLVAHYHFNSQSVANLYKKYFLLSPRKITVIPNGLNIKKYSPNINTSELKRKLNIDQEKTIIGCIAKMRKLKGHSETLNAFSKLIKENPNYQLLFIGDGPEKENIQNQITNLNLENYVTLLGNRTDIPQLLQVIDIFILLSAYEGMSNAIIEAMAAKKPIIASDTSENKDVLTNNETALLVNRSNSNEINQAILKISNNFKLKETLSLKAFKKSIEKYSIEKNSQSFLNLIEKTINN